MFNKFLIVLSACIFLSFINVKALSFSDFSDDNLFYVYSLTYEGYEEIGSSDTYKKALDIYNKNKDNYENLSIYSDGVFFVAEYAIVTFKSTSTCDYNVEFTNADNKSKNYLNGCYGFDGAYLETDSTGKKVKFKISGIEGWANFDDITIYPLQLLPGRLSKYKVINGELFHQIKQDFSTDYYGSLINLGPSPDYLLEGNEYYSYDGNYFYEDDSLWMMLDDYKSNNTISSINNNNPYYNYYQYLSHRSITSYDETDVNNYINNVLHINSNIKKYADLDKDSTDDTLTNSQFYNQAFSFFQYQYQFGSNALMMLSLSWNETALGRSSLAFTRNNLFGHSAFDSDVEKNASRYNNLSSSVYSHARYYVSNSYCNPSKFQYHGCYFGNKANGMNVSYASDPYWGEKAAQNYYQLDKALGMNDFNKYTIGIKTKYGKVNVYSEASTSSNVLYKTDDTKNISFLILDDYNDEFYKIQSDATIKNNKIESLHYYDFTRDIGYIKKSDIQVVLEGSNESSNFVKVSFDSNGGSFKDDFNVITYYIEDTKVPSIEYPIKENHLFIGWDKEVVASNEEQYYIAQYKEVDSISIYVLPETQYEIKDRINIKDGSILVEFKDGTQDIVLLSTEMISGFDFNVPGDQEVIVTYGGKTTSYTINVSEELDTIRNEIKDEIISIIDDYLGKEILSDTETIRVLNLKLKIDEYMLPYLNQQQLRDLDKIINTAIGNNIHYLVEKSEFDASVSGLSTSIKLNDSLDKGYFKDTYKLSVQKDVSSNAKTMMEKVALGNGYTIFDVFSVKLSKRNGSVDLHAPVIISIKKPEDSDLNQLFNILRYDNGEVVENYTKQSQDYIQFMTRYFGEFMIVAKNTTNIYDLENIYENVSYLNSDVDQYEVVFKAVIASIVLLTILVLGIILIRKKKKNDK
ncbi:MAG: hypothetical protein GX675_00730 [Erysipelotrichaceae bacterium]|nr:hypothetical protein [Erysipelotrichaceae bacterium]